MIIDIIICTYNRTDRVLKLIDELLKCKPVANSIIVVDSSDTSILKNLICHKATYIESNRKNQPYQRYLGYLNSKADILVYLDDDMEIVEYSFIEDVIGLFKNIPLLSGIAVNFKDKQLDNSLSLIPKSSFKIKNSKFSKWVKAFTGYPVLGEGKWGMNGNRGPQPCDKGGATEWLSGGAFVVKQNCMYQNFNFQLFDLFESGLGMGEDGVLGYTLSKQGLLYYYPKLLFYHNDMKDSTYSLDLYKFSRRVIYSRLYLSLEKSRLDNTSQLKAYSAFIWYGLWRILGLLINLIINYSSNRMKILSGTTSGFLMAFKFKYRFINKFNY